MPRFKSRTFWISILIGIFPLMFLGCAFLNNPPQTPTVHVTEVRIKEFNGLEAVFSVKLDVINPNQFSFVVKGASCDFSFNNIHVATGVSNIVTEIPASGTAVLSVDIYTSVLNILKCAQSINQKKSQYKVKGQLNLEAGHFLPLTIPVQSEGDLDINDLLKRKHYG
jgi:LEA14-like dessication related protein